MAWVEVDLFFVSGFGRGYAIFVKSTRVSDREAGCMDHLPDGEIDAFVQPIYLTQLPQLVMIVVRHGKKKLGILVLGRPGTALVLRVSFALCSFLAISLICMFSKMCWIWAKLELDSHRTCVDLPLLWYLHLVSQAGYAS